MEKGFINIPLWVLNSNYYRYVLSDTDKNILHYLWANVSIGNSEYYKNGLLVTNIKEQTLIRKSGETYHTLIRHLKRLDSLGVIVKVRSKVKHNRYFMGLRTANDDRAYLLHHLIIEHGENLDKNILNQISECKEKWHSPKIKDISPYRIDINYKDFVVNNIDNPRHLIYGRIGSGKTLFETLFNRNDMYNKPLPRMADLSGIEGIKKIPQRAQKDPQKGSKQSLTYI